MLGRLGKSLGLLFAILLSAPIVAAPAPIYRIVAVGDLHGDYSAWRDIARAAQLEDAGGHWTGGATVLVQCGDVVDRGPDSLKIVLDLMRLQKEAPKAGGRVITLVGNHEAMNVTDDLRYVSAGDYAAFTDAGSAALRDQLYTANQAAIEAAYRKQNPEMTAEAIRQAWLASVPLGQIEHQRAWHPDGRIGRWVAGNPAVALLDGTLFVHGGIGLAYAKMSVAEINKRVDAALAARDTSEAAIINDPVGPLWYRGLVTRAGDDTTKAPVITPAQPPLSIEDELTQVLAAYGARRMVIAHTPILSGIAILHDGRLIRIDTGISAFYGGKVSYLEILDGTLLPHEVARSVASQGGAR